MHRLRRVDPGERRNRGGVARRSSRYVTERIEQIAPIDPQEHPGHFLVVDGTTGRYEIADLAASDRMVSKHPDTVLYGPRTAAKPRL